MNAPFSALVYERRSGSWIRRLELQCWVCPVPVVVLDVDSQICGWTLARAHARSGDPIAIAAYLGDDDQFDRSITDFAKRYADQNEHDGAVAFSQLEAC